MSSSNKKIILKQSINQTSSSSSSQRDFPALPIHPNRFGPIAPRARPPYSALVQNIPISTPTINQNSPSRSPIPMSPRSPFITPTSPSTSNQTGIPEYHINPNKQIVKILEPLEEQKLSQNFLTLTDYLYPKGCHFYVDNYKTREYYQAILTESKSVIIDHTINKKTPDYIDCSKAKILKVITPEEWSIKPFDYKTLSSYPSYPVYNYYDYQDAWLYAFLLRSFSHTWFFYFSESFKGSYPRWFIKWFRYYGNIPATFPERILEGFNKYKDYFMQDHIPPAEYVLQFSAIFKLPWIIQFTYKKQEAQDTSPPLFYRQFSVKWWKKIEEKQADINAVISYYKKYNIEDSSTQVPEIQDEDFIKRLQSCSSKEEMQRIINEIKGSPNSSEDLFQDSQDPYEDIILN